MSGGIQLLQGDCLELLKGIPDGTVDMICADLPYGTTNCHWDVRLPMAPLWEQFWRVAKHNAAICLFAQQPFATDLINAARKWFRYEWVFVKKRALGFLDANRRPLRAHKLILVFYRSLPTFHPQKTGDAHPHFVQRKADMAQIYHTHRKSSWSDGKRFPRDVVEIHPSIKPAHPCEKPCSLLEMVVKTYTNAGELVLDPTMGSGSCGVACANTGRRFVGMEKDAHFFEVAQGRIAEAAGVAPAPPAGGKE